jgi:hypothetical protein
MFSHICEFKRESESEEKEKERKKERKKEKLRERKKSVSMTFSHAFSDENMMDPYNLAICFGPTLVPIPEDRDQVQYQNLVNELIKNFIIFHEDIFPTSIPGKIQYMQHIKFHEPITMDKQQVTLRSRQTILASVYFTRMPFQSNFQSNYNGCLSQTNVFL